MCFCFQASQEQFGFIPDTGTLGVGAVLADQVAQALQANKDAQLVALDFKGRFRQGVVVWASRTSLGCRGARQGLQAL